MLSKECISNGFHSVPVFIVKGKIYTARCDNISTKFEITVSSRLKFVVTMYFSLVHNSAELAIFK